MRGKRHRQNQNIRILGEYARELELYTGNKDARKALKKLRDDIYLRERNRYKE